MSKLNFSIIGILVIFVTLITFSSCNKEAELETTNDEVLERILDFKQKVENPNQQKSGEEISVEDAVWLVEAALNYSYCVFEEEVQFDNMQLDSLNFELNSNSLDFIHVINIYNEINQIVSALQENNMIYIIDVYNEDSNLKVKIFYGEENLQKAYPIWSGFHQEYHYTDADDAIENIVNRRRTFIVPASPFYITDIETTEPSNANGISYLRNLDSNDPCFVYYYTFYESSGNIDPNGTWSPILTIAEMNLYYYGAFTAANLVQINEGIDSKKQFLSINLEDDAMFTGEEYYPILHWYDFTYGILRPASIITE